MRVRLTPLCVIFLLFLVPLGIVGCAGDQQQAQEAVNADQGESEYEDEQGEQGADEESEYDDEQGQESAEYDEEGQEGEEGDDYGDNYADEDAEGEGEGDVAEEGGEEGGDDYANLGGDDVLENNDVVDNSLADSLEENPAAMDQAAAGDNYAANNGASVDGGVVESNQTIDPMAQPVASSGDAGGVTPAALPEWGSKMPYIVKKGDTLGDIAGQIYGDRSKWREMSELSSLINPNLIYIGDVVYYQLTQETMAFATTYESLPRQEVVVQEGDTLSTIASRVLNAAEDWKHIWRQNDTVSDPDNLTAGTVLYYIAPGALSAALEQTKAQEYQIVEDVNVEVKDVKVTVDLKVQTNRKAA